MSFISFESGPSKRLVTFLLPLLLLSSPAIAQNTQGGTSVFRSEIDELLTVRKISILPFADNVNGIYSRPLESHIAQTIGKDHRWDLVEPNTVGPIVSPDELEESTDKVAAVTANLLSDAVIAARITKGPKGIGLKLSLFLTRDKKLLAKSEVAEFNRFEVEQVKDKMTEMLNEVLGRIPYQGMVLSRQGTRVTINLGKADGITPGKVVTVIQIIKATRHPKFHFLINTETEILGKIKLVKVDDTLSFGKIITEKTKGTIQKDAKLTGIDFVSYAEGGDWSEDKEKDALMQRPDSQISFGKGAVEWLPKKPPTFGQVGARLGLATFQGNMNLSSETLSASSPYYPSVSLDAELWLTQRWTIHASMRQGIIPISNPKSGTGTNKLSQSLSAYDLMFGYTTRFGSGVWGPKVEVLGGYGNYRLFVDDTEDALGEHGLTTLNYGGLKFGLLGSYPITMEDVWSLGAKLYFFFNPTLKETPISSGRSTNTINHFGLFVERKLSVNLKAQASLDFELYSTEFSGGRASSSSQKHTTLSAAIFYLF